MKAGSGTLIPDPRLNNRHASMIDFDRYVLAPALTTFGRTVLYFRASGRRSNSWPCSMSAIAKSRFGTALR